MTSYGQRNVWNHDSAPPPKGTTVRRMFSRSPAPDSTGWVQNLGECPFCPPQCLSVGTDDS